ncbi:MFS general substrate transporter, partial [Calocera cornea HHB12733]
MDIATIELSELRHQPDSAAPTQEVLPDTAVVASELAPVDRGRDAWTFVASSFILETFLWGFAFCFGIFQNYLVSNPASPFYGSSNTAISIIGTCSLAVQYGFGFFPVMPIFSLYPHHVKTMLWSSLGVACGALVLSSFATKIWHLILLQGVVLGAAGGALYGPVLLWLPEWFVERRGLAGGIIFAGTGIGGGLFPVLLGTLLERTGFRWTMRIWAGLVTVFAGTALWVVKPRIRPSRARGARMAPVDWSFFKNRTFAVVGMTVFIQALAFFPVSLYLPAYTASLGLPAVDGQLVLSTFNIFSVLGQVIFGYLCDKVSYSQVILISSVGSALAAYLLWGFARNLSLVFAFVVVFGTLGGGFSSIG